MEEIWKDIKGYEGLYQVSNLGSVRSLNYNHTKDIKLIKLVKSNCDYLRVQLHFKGKAKHYSVHRLVAEAFLENNNNYPCVNHIDENKLNNKVSNLEWCTHKYNNCYGNRLKKISRKIIQYDKKMTILKIWNSAREAGLKLKIDSSTITKCCRGNKKTCGGYYWKYKD